MDKERESKIIIYSGLFLFAFLAFAAGMVFGYSFLIYALILLLLFLIFIAVKLYLRVQHNIDRTRFTIEQAKTELQKMHEFKENSAVQNYRNDFEKFFPAYEEWLKEKIMPSMLDIIFKKENEIEDVSVIIGWKNIGCSRAYNALKSIRAQDYDQQKINIIFVDYGSDDSQAVSKIKNMCQEFRASYIRVENAGVWNRSHCLNIGIKKSKSKFVLFSDIDIIFEKNYISVCVKEMKKNSFQVLYTNMLCRPKNSDSEEKKDDYYELKSNSFLYQRIDINPESNPELSIGTSILFTLRNYIYMLNGLDEVYNEWGYEDCDLIKRLKIIGIKISNISHKTSHIHQWHSMYAGVKSEGLTEKVNKNERYFSGNNSILRNKEGWGEDIDSNN